MTEQPVILVVDDDMSSLTITEQELRKRYGRDYRVLARQSAAAALDELRRAQGAAGIPSPSSLPTSSCPRCPAPSSSARRASSIPVAKRVMLVSWGDRSSPQAILDGCAVGQIEFFITKPWHTAPDERFHREIADFLYEWARLQRPVYEAVRLVGERWARRSNELRDLLGRNGVAYGFYDADSEEGQAILREAGVDEAPRLPVAVVFGGRVLEDPTQPGGGGVAGRAQPAVRRRVRPRSSSARGRPASRPPCTARRRASAPWCSSVRPSAGKPARAR